jgi:3-phenylpropionate/trans-cinnamate dioxygenase ferredoxin reductase subunit
MIAAGVGITPMMSMLRTLAGRRDRRPLLLVRTAHRAEDLLFGAELAGLARVLDLTVVDVPAGPSPRRTGAAGTLHDVLARMLPRAALRGELAYFVCGPPALVGGALGALRALGVPEARIHTEQFDT